MDTSGFGSRRGPYNCKKNVIKILNTLLLIQILNKVLLMIMNASVKMNG